MVGREEDRTGKGGRGGGNQFSGARWSSPGGGSVSGRRNGVCRSTVRFVAKGTINMRACENGTQLVVCLY